MSNDLDVVAKAKLVNRNSLEQKTEEKAEELQISYFDLRKTPLSKEILENFDPKDFFDFSAIPLKEERGSLIITSPNHKSKKLEDFQAKYKKAYPKTSLAMISAESFRDNEGPNSEVDAFQPENRNRDEESKSRGDYGSGKYSQKNR